METEKCGHRDCGGVPILGAVTQSDRRSIVHRERTSGMIQGWAHATLTYITHGQEQQGRHGASFRMESPPIGPLPCRAPCHIGSLFSPSSQPAEVMASPVSFLLTQRLRSKCQVLAFKASCHLSPIQSLLPPRLHQSGTVISTHVLSPGADKSTWDGGERDKVLTPRSLTSRGQWNKEYV